MIEGRKVKFYGKDGLESGMMHQWFLCEGSVYIPYALIEKADGTMVFINYHDVIFEPIERSESE